MPDITMCSTIGCPNASHCYRARAEPSRFWQAYAAFPYRLTANGVICDHYIEANSKSQLARIDAQTRSLT